MSIATVDPGIRSRGKTAGWAVFMSKDLFAAGAEEKGRLLLPESPFVRATRMVSIGRVVVEHPRWYPHDHSDVNDLIDLAVLVGEVKYYFEASGYPVELVWPRTWKGNVPKEVMTQRVLACLTPEERALIPFGPRSKKPNHNCLDAVGIGLKKLWRLR